MKRVTFRVVVTMPDSTTKQSAREKMEQVLARQKRMTDAFVTTLQVDPVTDQSRRNAS